MKNKKESIALSFLSIIVAFLSLAPVMEQFFPYYSWIMGLLILNSAAVYMLLISNIKLIKIFFPITLISSAVVVYFIYKGDMFLYNFPLRYALIIFPELLFINIMLYIYSYRHKTKFQLTIALMSTFMILTGIYATFGEVFNLPHIPVLTAAGGVYAIIVGYFILVRGYLKIQGWRDYAIELEKIEKFLLFNLNNLKKAQIDSVIVLSQTIEAKDHYTRGHCLRVRDIVKVIGKELKFNKNKIFLLELGALLHDIGKIGISMEILDKPAKLTNEEFLQIKRHSNIGADILCNVDFFLPIIPMVRHHHEYYDGRGYPQGLKKREIPIEARILAVADAFDAMTSDRPYRKAYDLDKALSVLKEVSGTQLDPDLVHLFISKKIYKATEAPTDKLQLEF